MNNPTTRGKNISHLQLTLLEEMDGDDATRLISKIEQLMKDLPDPMYEFEPKQGLILGLVQSGKTVALTTAVAMAADNNYKCFIILTSDNLWLYEQTTGRLKRYLQRMQIEGKQQWDGQLFMVSSLKVDGPGLVLVTTKNATVLRSLIEALDSLKMYCGGELPPALIVDDEADQASLDTQTSKRSKNPDTPPGTISNLIDQIRQKFTRHVLLQVTATPQALFLQNSDHPYRPEFTVLIEPGKGYIGGNTFFSLDLERAESLIRHIEQTELDRMLTTDSNFVPSSLWKAICSFFVAATIKYLQNELARRSSQNTQLANKDPKFCFLCHISQKKVDHVKAYNIIVESHHRIVSGLGLDARDEEYKSIKGSLLEAYNDILMTLTQDADIPKFEIVVGELRDFIIGTEVQILNSDREEDQPKYDRRYNILIGGNKLSRGVTIPNLLVTYYGRKAQSPNMDTVLQHARMYGYRERYLDVTRVFLTPEVEHRFRMINESEQSLRGVIERYPGKEYRGIQIGSGLKATRNNILNPNSLGSYGAGRSYFPRNPLYLKKDIQDATMLIDAEIKHLVGEQDSDGFTISIDQAINLIQLTRSDPSGSGLWDNTRIVTALEKIKDQYHNIAHLIVKRNRNLGRNKKGQLGAVLSGTRGENNLGYDVLARTDCPTLYMFHLTGKKWDQHPFWVPVVRFPDGQYAILFNFE